MTTYNGYTESDERVKARLARAWKRHLEIQREKERAKQKPQAKGGKA